jgi:hypothetical protein
MNDFELYNLINHRNGELPQEGYLVFDIQEDGSQDKINKVIDVMRCIASYGEDNWPDDSTWKRVLPVWFSSKVMARDLMIILEDENLWDFGSWLDAMKFRGWFWYSSVITQYGFQITIIPYNLPYIIDPLRFLISETGVPNSKIRFIDRTV